MLHQFLNDVSKAALLEAIRSVEQQSSAEVVIAVRARSGRYLFAGWILGCVSAFVTLGFLLFSSFAFALPWILIDPVVVGAIVGFASLQLPTLERRFTSRKLLHKQVLLAAKASFYDKGVQLTSERVGILIYISLLEGQAEVIADKGIKTHVPKHVWNAAVNKIQGAVTRGDDGKLVANLIVELGVSLAAYLPRFELDVNELADEVCG